MEQMVKGNSCFYNDIVTTEISRLLSSSDDTNSSRLQSLLVVRIISLAYESSSSPLAPLDSFAADDTWPPAPTISEALPPAAEESLVVMAAPPATHSFVDDRSSGAVYIPALLVLRRTSVPVVVVVLSETCVDPPPIVARVEAFTSAPHAPAVPFTPDPTTEDAALRDFFALVGISSLTPDWLELSEPCRLRLLPPPVVFVEAVPDLGLCRSLLAVAATVDATAPPPELLAAMVLTLCFPDPATAAPAETAPFGGCWALPPTPPVPPLPPAAVATADGRHCGCCCPSLPAVEGLWRARTSSGLSSLLEARVRMRCSPLSECDGISMDSCVSTSLLLFCCSTERAVDTAGVERSFVFSVRFVYALSEPTLLLRLDFFAGVVPEGTDDDELWRVAVDSSPERLPSAEVTDELRRLLPPADTAGPCPGKLPSLAAAALYSGGCSWRGFSSINGSADSGLFGSTLASPTLPPGAPDTFAGDPSSLTMDTSHATVDPVAFARSVVVVMAATHSSTGSSNAPGFDSAATAAAPVTTSSFFRSSSEWLLLPPSCTTSTAESDSTDFLSCAIRTDG
uniref:Uncharacterized protein n=1 Tax=Anopheles atroparvus TaxID=41427 RepID=A0A182ITE1_ANOAO